MADTKATKLTPDEFNDLATRGTVTDVRSLAGDGYSFDEIRDILDSQKTARVAETQAMITAQADANAEAERRDREHEKTDKVHPHISVFSYSEGDRARPRPKFKCPTFWKGYELGHDTSTAQEIELVNRLEPGDYKIDRPDGSLMRVRVVGERDEVTGKLTKLDIKFDEGKGLRNPLFSQVVMLTKMIEQHAAQAQLVTA